MGYQVKGPYTKLHDIIPIHHTHRQTLTQKINEYFFFSLISYLNTRCHFVQVGFIGQFVSDYVQSPVSLRVSIFLLPLTHMGDHVTRKQLDETRRLLTLDDAILEREMYTNWTLEDTVLE